MKRIFHVCECVLSCWEAHRAENSISKRQNYVHVKVTQRDLD